MAGARCVMHGLAVGPDGRCVVCRREAASGAEPPAQPVRRRAGTVTPWLFVGVFAAIVAAAHFGIPGGLIPPLVSETLPGAPVHDLPPPTAAPAPKHASKAKSVDPSVLKFVSETFAPGTSPEPGAPALPLVVPPAPAPAFAPLVEAHTAQDAAQRKRDLERRAMIEKEWEDRARQRARSGITVTMYSAAWCGVCKRARTYMDGAHIAYVERDVDSDPAYAARARALNPRGSVPTFDIDGTVMIGFSPTGLEGAIQRAAAARSGR